MSEDLSRRKALSLLGLGAAFGLTASAILTPSAAEEATLPRLPPRRRRPVGPTGWYRRQSRRHGRHERRATRRGS